MKFEKIKNISKYKCFQDFQWQKFFNQEPLHPDVNVFYGENGSGKSSICNILKNVSGKKDFEKYKPSGVSLIFDSKEYKYSTDTWDDTIPEEFVLFFDREFVEKNIHVGHNRGTRENQHEQTSGKLIIEFDNDAITLRDARDKAKKETDDQQKEQNIFNGQNKDILDFSLSEEEEKFFEKYKDKAKEEIKDLKKQLANDKKTLDSALETDKGRQKRASEIQAIKEIEEKEVNNSLSLLGTYQAFFNIDLKGKARFQAENELYEKIKKHKDFFETGFHIREKQPAECPFCQSKTEEEGIKKVLQAYNDIFDETYKLQLQKFQNEKLALINELDTIETTLIKYDLNTLFLELKAIDEKHKISGIYSVDEEKNLKKPQILKIKAFKDKISNLEKPNKEDIKSLYNSVESEYKDIEKFFESISKLIKSKTELIKVFQKENTDEKLQLRIKEQGDKSILLQKEIDFLSGNKTNEQKKKITKVQELKDLEKVLETLKTAYSKAKKDYENYCIQDVFEKPIKGMLRYFKKFNFDFSLELVIEKRRTGQTKEFPFAFKVLDKEGNERDFKEGLSEGELQVLSICFFFAFLDIQSNSDKKILVFDDPITSLDKSNLSALVDLISEVQVKFSQTLVFTHHNTFFKFLRKKFGTSKKSDKKGNEYNIIRNRKKLGGSFICKSKRQRFLGKLKELENHIQSIPPGYLDVDLKTVEYGQYLRYECERFIKNDLLHWNANDFPEAIKGVKENKNIDDNDLDKIKDVYDFCNWTTSHVDEGDDHGLEQLKSKVEDFISVAD